MCPDFTISFEELSGDSLILSVYTFEDCALSSACKLSTCPWAKGCQDHGLTLVLNFSVLLFVAFLMLTKNSFISRFCLLEKSYWLALQLSKN